MRYTIAAVALFAASTVSQSIPSCAMGCVASPSTLGGCGQNDMKCLCGSKEFIEATTTCLNTACPADELAAARSVAISLCQAAGVTLDLPESAAASSGASTAPAASATAPTSSSAAAPAATSNAAASVGANTFAGIAALGLAALAL
ncbi:hypothetical protein BDN71DRAFT_1431151 [Pleurotus eryngii]|uniref:CFEM domain-containing protein n=1 Tax=Pleurotus eryngii TaxID=5323 RepID=A0A9P5ZY19_PLEER|nr:hypothetical protein BDN71DRAFT_1431151 [Pleurotus eryngii]